MGNLKARFSSRKPDRSTSANYANIEKDQIVRVHIIVQGSECPASILSNNTINNSGLNGLSVCGEIIVVTVLLIMMCDMWVLLEYNVNDSQNTTEFICYCWYKNFSNYNCMFRLFIVAIIRLYIHSFKSLCTNKPTRLCLMMRSQSS
jgi:hypothetical protein